MKGIAYFVATPLRVEINHTFSYYKTGISNPNNSKPPSKVNKQQTAEEKYTTCILKVDYMLLATTLRVAF